MTIFIADKRVEKLARGLLPKNVGIEVVDLPDGQVKTDYSVNQPMLAAIALAGHAEELSAALAGSPLARLALIELDPKHPKAGGADLIQLLMERVAVSHRQTAEARAVAAQLRSESLAVNTRLREIEQLLHSLGNPQMSRALSWQPAGAMLSLARGESVNQLLPISAVSLFAIDLWFPQVIMPVINDLSVVVEDASGQIYPMQAVSPDMGLETGWMRFCLAEPISGIGRDCRLKLTWSGNGSISLGLGQPVPDPRFRATPNTGDSPEETLALQAWHSLGGVRLPGGAPSNPSGRAVSIQEAEFIKPSALPQPELFAHPLHATDHVSTGFWEKENAVLVHPSRSGPACAIIRGVDLAGLSHISALVTVGHARAPNLNFAIGVAPHGLVDEDGFWQRRIGPWLAGMPAQGWGQAHCIPVEPITGKADILLAVSLSTDVPNDFSWGLFQGFRFSRGNQVGATNDSVIQSDPSQAKLVRA